MAGTTTATEQKDQVKEQESEQEKTSTCEIGKSCCCG